MLRLTRLFAFTFVSTFLLPSVLIVAKGEDFSPNDIVLNCTLTSIIDGPSRSAPSRKINRDFVVAFNDTSKRVTFIGGILIEVEDTEEKNRRAQIHFWDRQFTGVGKTMPDFFPDRSFYRYTVTVNRLSGNINVITTHVFPDGRAAVEQSIEFGTCVSGRRKF